MQSGFPVWWSTSCPLRATGGGRGYIWMQTIHGVLNVFKKGSMEPLEEKTWWGKSEEAVIKGRHVGRGNQERKTWRAISKRKRSAGAARWKSGVKETEGWERVEDRCRGKQEVSVYMGVNNFRAADSRKRSFKITIRGDEEVQMCLWYLYMAKTHQFNTKAQILF